MGGGIGIDRAGRIQALVQILDPLGGKVAVKKAADVCCDNMSSLQGSRDIDCQRPVTAQKEYLLPGQQNNIFEMRFYGIKKGRQLLALGFGQVIGITLHGKSQHAAG